MDTSCKLQHKDDVHKINTHETKKLQCDLLINTWQNVSSNIKIQNLEDYRVTECKFVRCEPPNLWRIQIVNGRKSGKNIRARGERFGEWPKLK